MRNPGNRAQLLDSLCDRRSVARRGGADFHALDDVDRRRQLEVLHELRIVVNQRT